MANPGDWGTQSQGTLRVSPAPPTTGATLNRLYLDGLYLNGLYVNGAHSWRRA